jgi:hypothetical protein
VNKWFPNPTLPKEEQIRDKKKLVCVSIEKEGYIVFAIVPKCYILKSSKNDDDQEVKKMKGVSRRLNDNIDLESYKSCLLKSSVPVSGFNRGFMVVESDPFTHTRQMVKYVQRKKAANGNALDKMIVLENYSYTPFLHNFTKDDYYFAKWMYYFFCIVYYYYYLLIVILHSSYEQTFMFYII